MKSLRILIFLFFAIGLISGCTHPAHRTKSVNVKIQSIWKENPDLPMGGVIIGRGEGANGVITVNLPIPDAATPNADAVRLTAESVTHMDLNALMENGEVRHFGDEDIRTAAYLLEFEHIWEDGATVRYVLRNNYDGE